MEPSELMRLLQTFLMTSYLYYIRNYSVIPDTEYDQIAQTLLKHWDAFEHQHKHLVTMADLESGSLFTWTAADYPGMVVGGAEIWLEKYLAERKGYAA